MKKTFIVTVSREVEVTLDETKFTEEFLNEFASTIASYDSIMEHAEHLGWLHATGVYDLNGFNDEFIEGYGNQSEFGIKVETLHTDTDVVGI